MLCWSRIPHCWNLTLRLTSKSSYPSVGVIKFDQDWTNGIVIMCIKRTKYGQYRPLSILLAYQELQQCCVSLKTRNNKIVERTILLPSVLVGIHLLRFSYFLSVNTGSLNSEHYARVCEF